MLEISPSRAAVIRCFGVPRALDAFPSLGAFPGRVAPDELWLIAPLSAGAEIARRAGTYLAGADPDGLVVDHGEAWAVWSVSGTDPAGAFARLADFPLPAQRPAFVQGAVVQVPAKILLPAEGLHVIVPVQLGHHVPERFLQACSDLSPTIGVERELVAEDH